MLHGCQVPLCAALVLKQSATAATLFGPRTLYSFATQQEERAAQVEGCFSQPNGLMCQQMVGWAVDVTRGSTCADISPLLTQSGYAACYPTGQAAFESISLDSEGRNRP